MKQCNARWAIAILCTLATIARADDSAAFKTTLAAGLGLTDGNSETLQANATLITEGVKRGFGSVRAGLTGNYGESTVDGESQTNVENLLAFANAKRDLNEMVFAYLDITSLYDSVAEIDYRTTLGPGIGRYFMRDDIKTLSMEIGPSYVWEKVDGITEDYPALRIAERYDRKLSSTAKVWQSAEYLPEMSDFANYLFNFEIGVEAALNSRFNLRLVFQDRYDSEPGKGLEKNDIILTAGIGMTL